MPSTILDDVIFPDGIIAVAARGKKSFATQISTSAAGYENRNATRSLPKRQYEVGAVARTAAQWAQIDALHDVVFGSAYGFLLKDPTNNSATSATGLMRPLPASLSGTLGTIGLGYGVPSYRLLKRTAFLARNADRDVRKPIASTVGLLRNGGAVTIGAGAGNAAIDAVNGNVTFVADSSSTVTAVAVGATTNVTLTAALSGLAIGGRLYLSGLTGTVASTLNGQSFAITAITGGGLNVYTLTVATTGLAWTSGGSGFKYPQPTDNLSWTGSFYVPVRFETDDLDWSMLSGNSSTDLRLIEGPSITLIEVLVP
jgi:uncharacterized protein (TIGR02217 family)